MTENLLNIAFYLLIVATVPGIWRMARGPTVVDRILAFDAVVMCSVGQIVLLSRLWETPLYLDLILIVSSLGFLSTVALVFYLQISLPTPGRVKKEGEL
jgi:multicomponent Na+:H+ antiporter subunit F